MTFILTAWRHGVVSFVKTRRINYDLTLKGIVENLTLVKVKFEVMT